MLIEISPSWQLVNPAYALALGLLIILAIALIAYFLTRNSPQLRRWQALISEVLVAVGVIGLVTFAARVHMESEIRQDSQQIEAGKSLAQQTALTLIGRNCASEPSSIRPTPELENIWIACRVAYRLLERDEDNMNYLIGNDQLKRLKKTQNQKIEVATQIEELRVAVNNVVLADRQANHNLHRKMLVERDVSWILILMCAVSAMLGIGLKWAKAIFEFRKAAAR